MTDTRPPLTGMNRLLGCWPISGNVSAKRAHTAAVAGLVEMCVDNDVLPDGDPTVSTFTNRQDILLAAHELGCRLVDLLNLAEKIGFGRKHMFVAAVVPVRGAWDTTKVAA